MSLVRTLVSRLRGTLARRAGDEEMDEEFRFHIEMQTAKNQRRGMPADEARRRALLAFGGRERFREEGRDERRSRVLEDLARDVRYAIRTLRRAPGFTAVAVLSLALGVGANTAVFGIVDAVLLRPLPYPAPERLVSVLVKDAAEERASSLSDADFVALEAARSLERFGVYFRTPGGITLTGLGEPEQLEASWVSAGLLPALGVAPALGRVPHGAEDDAGGSPVVVVGHAFWRDRLGGTADALDRALTLDGESYRMIGVMPPGFALPGSPDDALWPVARYATPEWRAPFYLAGVGRLADGVSAEQARAELATIATAVKERFPDSQPHWTYAVEDLKARLVSRARETVVALYAAVALVLLLAAANVANLFLARATTRRPELALRTALGAGRARLARQLLTESVLVSLVGGALGLVLATWAIDAVVAAAPPGLPRLHEVRVDRAVLAVTGGVSLVVGIAIGLAPALLVPHRALGSGLRDDARGATAGGDRRRLRAALVVAEFALALAILVGAGLTVNSLLRLQRVDAGAATEGVLVARVAIPEARYREPSQVESYFDELEARVAALPGVRAAGVSMAVPPDRLVMRNPYTPEGLVFGPDDSAPVAEQLLVTPGYFRALDVPLRAGRSFTREDREGAPEVVIVNETFARRHFPQGAVGRWIQTGDPDPGSPRMTIVGVVGDVKYQGLDAAPEPTIYVPYAQHLWWRAMYVVARTVGDPAALAPALRREVAAVDAEVPVQTIRTMDALVGESVAQPRFRATLLGAFGVLALVLAGAGIYGVMSYDVDRRRRETGVRLALGATRSGIVRMVVLDGMRLAALGITLGAALAVASSRVLGSVLYGVGPMDPATWIAMALFLAGVGLAATVLPALRASRTDPATTLRGE